ncbi:MAG: hypothetical protein KAU21_21475 [Gammaproteobacteria bacterium]|nr:hypothetical protein [Gammaproteobacteria bacterium]
MGGYGLIETDDAGLARDPQVAIDAIGNIMVVWFQNDGTRYNIWARYYDVNSGWGAAELIETDNTGSAEYPQVTFDGNGNAIAVWDQNNGSWDDVWANRFVAGTGWGTAELIETEDQNAYIPQVAVDDNGNAIAVWVQEGGTQNIMVNRYVVGMGWGAAELIENDTGSAYAPQVAIDASGNAISVWDHNEGLRNIWANRFE